MNKILKSCKKHGDLEKKDLIKKSIDKKGVQKWRCKHCMSDLHKENYKKNKEKVLKKCKLYREENKELVLQWKRDYSKKHKERDRSKKQSRDKKRRINMVKNLTDEYMKHLISKRSAIKFNDIPQSLIALKRSLLIVKGKIKEQRMLNKDDNNHENKKL